MVVFGADQKGDGGLIEAACLAIPLLDRVERGFARQVKHEQDGDGVVAYERKHVDEFALASEIPDAERDLGVADRDGLLHKVDAEGLDVVLVEGSLDVANHEGCLADLRVANHANFEDHTRRCSRVVSACRQVKQR